MIYQQLDTVDVSNLLRSDEYASWSIEAAWALAEHLIELSDECGDIAFDLVSIRCEYSEYKLRGLVAQYSHYFTGENIIEEVDSFLDDLRENTGCVILLDNGNILLQEF